MVWLFSAGAFPEPAGKLGVGFGLGLGIYIGSGHDHRCREHADIVGEAHDRDEIGDHVDGRDEVAERAVDHHFRLERHGRIVQRVEQAQGAAYALTADFLRVPFDFFPKLFGGEFGNVGRPLAVFLFHIDEVLVAHGGLPSRVFSECGHGWAVCQEDGAIIKKALPIFKKLFTKYDAMNESVQENIGGMRVVKAYVREDYESKKFAGVSNELCREFTKAEKILAFNSPLMQICLQGALLALGFFGSRIILFTTGTTLDAFGLQSLTTYSLQILMSLMTISMMFVTIVMSLESARRIVEVLSEKSTITNPSDPVMQVKNGDIAFENVSFKYSTEAKKYALENINLDIKSGQTIGVIGGTGSSKTTLVNLISRLYDVTEGSVKVGDVDVRKYDTDVLRKSVAVVLQKNMLFSGTIKENIRWGKEDATDEEIIAACKLAQADEFITQFPNGYDTVIDQGGANVSGGQKQRLCIARAIISSPKVLILDDSTSAVDMKTDALLRDAFKKFIPETTKIIIAQRIASVMDADQIVVMENGKINAVGSHEQLIETNEIYREVYYSQNKNSESEGGGQNG